MSVILNRWMGNGFENEVVCDICGKSATVNVGVIKGRPVALCKKCLEEMVWEIENALMAVAEQEGGER